MSKQTVQGMILERQDRFEAKLDVLIEAVAGLKVKAAIAGGLAGLVGTGIVSVLIAFFK